MEFTDDADRILDRIQEHEQEIKRLKLLLAKQSAAQPPAPYASDLAASSSSKWPMKHEEYQRYGRQLILPEIGINGQLKLRSAKVLIVGIGGLGCPAAAYLAGAGVDTLGLMDGDRVDASNLHRQILHSTDRIGLLKVESAELALRQINPLVQYKLHPYHLDAHSAVTNFSQYDLVLDCTDHPTSRYLVSDAAVCAGIPLVSGAALRTDGQLYILNFPPFNPKPGPDYVSGPCYRCVHPKPPPVETLVTCGEGGILGPVVGTIGLLMATETIKIIASSTYFPQQALLPSGGASDGEAAHATSSDKQAIPAPTPSMLMYSAYANPPFRSIRIRGRRPNCAACSSDPALRTINAESIRSGVTDYVAFCGQLSPSHQLPPEERVEARELAGASDSLMKRRAFLLDVRTKTEFEICNLAGSMHVPLEEVKKRATEIALRAKDEDRDAIVAVCRFGNDSQVAAKILQEDFDEIDHPFWVGDLRGGLAAWTKDVDPSFPEY